MKKLLFSVLFYFITTQLFAQATEFSFGVNGGLMHFSGSTATSTSAINEGVVNYTNNPYGSKNGLGYGIYIQGQYITVSKFILGLQLGTDNLNSKVTITEINRSAVPFPIKATGSSAVNAHYLNANPYAGMRFVLSNIKLDITAGLEFAYVADAYDEGEAKNSYGTKYKTNNDIKNINMDTRLKLGVAAHYDRLGITLSYAHGLSNYLNGSLGTMAGGTGNTTFSAHTEVIRLGINCIVF
ncbi:PorT family protein [Mucilaginibacter sp. 14171R-50]|uniref:outer membrane beta-barrel protein n=1 Tax=Mucilaginibacter sp. 14171R-50 TaxID=2703789 RepID=UPI00138BE880|nr:outer membrane beta-barrel protein [Mucilaginibacter sp. 14171R-50]QHS56152.1 PorT family protein [Mucilaginibacter sp. 14171R-50]